MQITVCSGVVCGYRAGALGSPAWAQSVVVARVFIQPATGDCIFDTGGALA